MEKTERSALILGLCIFCGLIGMAFIVGYTMLEFKSFERVVTVKGLSEREVPATITVWPIRFSEASNDLSAIYTSMERSQIKIIEYLQKKGFTASEISIATPSIIDKMAQQYGGGNPVGLRYTASQGLTVRSGNVELVRSTMKTIVELGKSGIVLGGYEYQVQPQFLFTQLNDLKPEMIEEATRSARSVAEKFASDSNSKLGKIRSASQGQFSIEDLDVSTPHIKKVRVVSTVEYYLSD